MSARLRREQCCVALEDGKRCQRPQRELGRLCTRHWQALSPQSRAFLKWSAAWEDTPQKPLLSRHVSAAEMAAYDPVAGAERILREAP